MGVNIYYLQLMFFLNKFLLAVEIDEKGHTDRDLIFEILFCEFIRISISNAKNGYDLD